MDPITNQLRNSHTVSFNNIVCVNAASTSLVSFDC